MSSNMENKAVVITGSSKGIGLACAQAFAAAGARVALVARSRANLDAALAAMPKSVHPPIAIVADLTRADESARMVREAVAAASATTNREAALYWTPAGGLLAFVVQSSREDNVLNEVFATLADSAPRIVWIRRGNCSTQDIEALLRTHAVRIEALQREADTRFLVVL